MVVETETRRDWSKVVETETFSRVSLIPGAKGNDLPALQERECVGIKWYDRVIPLTPMGVLALGSAHARPSAQPTIDVSGNFLAHVFAESRF